MRQRFNRLILGVTLCLVLCFSGFVPGVTVVSAAGIDVIPDAALRALIRETLTGLTGTSRWPNWLTYGACGGSTGASGTSAVCSTCPT